MFEWHQLKEIDHPSRCHAIGFAPETTLAVLPKLVKLCAAGSDFALRIYRSNLADSDSVQVLHGHSGYVNDLAWDPEGKFLATVSDDQSCIIWNNHDDYGNRSMFHLRSAGMSVKWHQEDTEKILVAEKRGLIHMYNVVSQQTVLSVETHKSSPLMSADWSISNRLCIVALAGGNIITWNLKNRW